MESIESLESRSDVLDRDEVPEGRLLE